MIKRKIYSKIGWRKYLDPTKGKRVRRFIESNGDIVFNQVFNCIKSASSSNEHEVAILVHPNVSAIVVVDETEFDEVLSHCLDYFEFQEAYEKCNEIVILKKKIKESKEI